VLGRIIEQVTKRSYEAWFGKTSSRRWNLDDADRPNFLQGKTTGEVTYVGPAARPASYRSSEPVESAYGAWYMEAMDAHAPEYRRQSTTRGSERDRWPARIEASGQRECCYMQPAPLSLSIRANPAWYAMGTAVNTSNHWWHSGALDGTATYQIRTGDGFTYACF